MYSPEPPKKVEEKVCTIGHSTIRGKYRSHIHRSFVCMCLLSNAHIHPLLFKVFTNFFSSFHFIYIYIYYYYQQQQSPCIRTSPHYRSWSGNMWKVKWKLYKLERKLSLHTSHTQTRSTVFILCTDGASVCSCNGQSIVCERGRERRKRRYHFSVNRKKSTTKDVRVYWAVYVYTVGHLSMFQYIWKK